MRRWLVAVGCGWLMAGATAQTVVEQFSPEGTVKGVRQATARFSADVVPFGDLRLTDPFTVDCGVPGKGRWIDSRQWAYDFERDLPAGQVCRFTLKPGVADLAGKPLAGPRAFSFSTGGPAVIHSAPREGSQVDENQVFVLGLDAPATDASIQAHAWCRVEGVGEKIPVRLLEGKERADILAQRRDFVDSYLRVYFRQRGAPLVGTVAARAKLGKDAPLVVLQCQRHWPADTEVSLIWDAGVATAGGVATTEAQTLPFRVRPDLRLSTACERVNVKSACIPFLPVHVNLTAPISVADARAITLTAPSHKVFKPTISREDEKLGWTTGFDIAGPFPPKTALAFTVPPGLKDDAGRELANRASLPAVIRMAEQPPLVKFPARFGILEAHGDRLLPVTVRNVEAPAAPVSLLRLAGPDDALLLDWLHRMSGKYGLWQPREQDFEDMRAPLLGPKAEGVERLTLPRTRGRATFEVLGIPLPKPGFYVTEVASPYLGSQLAAKPATAYVSSAALVTNMAVHFKHGAKSSLAWVTSLDHGRPIAGALVQVSGCDGKLLWKGKTDAAGIARIATPLEARCKGPEDYFISARRGDDMSFTLESWNRGIESWRFNLPTDGRDADNIIAATVFDRTLLRAGETVHMKHFVREHVAAGLAVPPLGKNYGRRNAWRARQLGIDEHAVMPAKAWLVHQGSDQRYEVELQWHPDGSAESTWKIPPDAKLGTYEIMLGERGAGEFRVEQFRIPLMRAVVKGPEQAPVAPPSVPVDLQLSYLAGGPAALAPVKLRTTVEDRYPSFPDYDGFAFTGRDVKEGVERNIGTYDEESFDDGEAPEDEAAPGAHAAVRTQSLTLDKSGGARVDIANLGKVTEPKDLLAEMSYQDPNGETMTASRRIALWPAAVVVGLKVDGWLATKEKVRFQAVVLDPSGQPVADAPVTVDYLVRENYSHRRRLLGGFYSYENTSEIRRLGEACTGRTDARGMLFCETKAPADGNLILRARAGDSAGRASFTSAELWVAGDADAWFAHSDNDRIDLLPLKKRYEPGEDASFQVRSPFRNATVLLTVEREGVLDAYVRRITGADPVVRLPVKPNYAPNVYVSALVVRGRVAGVQPTALVDLGKPAYKLGITPLRVGWAAHELKVQVTPARQVYKVRETADVDIHVTRADGSAPPAGTEVALAAVDEGLLELKPNDSWDLLDAMMQQRSLQVTTSTAQMQVIGKRHFGRKAVAAGGGGGRGIGRELFDTLLSWQPRVQLDAHGDAHVRIPLNDSLTSFRIAAVANGGAQLFGTGKASIRSTQDLMLLPGLPPLVREGDRQRVSWTVRNAGAAPLTASVQARAKPSHGAPLALASQAVTLQPGEAREVGWDVAVPVDARSLAWEATASAGEAHDTVRTQQEVIPAIPVRTLQATLLQLDRAQSVPVRMPADAAPGRGGVATRLSARIAGSMPGVQRYMEDYPYTCFEQVTSRAVALRDEKLWDANMRVLPTYLDGDGLVKYFPQMEYGSDVLTAYVLSVGAEAGYDIPDDLRGRMRDGLANFVRGKVVRWSALPTADVAVRKVAALEALSREGGIAADMTQSFTIQPNLWPTAAVIDWYLAMLRSPQVPNHAAQLDQAERILRARLNLQGTTMGFSTERTDNWWWLMMSGDENANRLLLAMLDNPRWRTDMGRLARGAMGRQVHGHWSTTPANAWGVLAMHKFSERFESQPVAGATSVALGGKQRKVAWKDEEPSEPAVTLPWPQGTQNLSLRHEGSGKPWAVVQSLAAIPLKAPLSSGYQIKRTVTAVERQHDGAWTRGDIYRVRLELEAQADMTWVVVDDPVPAGATILGSGLGGDSHLATAGERSGGWVWPAFQERTLSAFRSYYEFVPKGKWTVEYTVRLNNPGQFQLPPTRVEAMYNPEMFGEVPNAGVTVGP
ncbi:MAG: alpha-2-macroglobulin family protein [Telluria sp.]